MFLTMSYRCINISESFRKFIIRNSHLKVKNSKRDGRSIRKNNKRSKLSRKKQKNKTKLTQKKRKRKILQRRVLSQRRLSKQSQHQRYKRNRSKARNLLRRSQLILKWRKSVLIMEARLTDTIGHRD